MIGLDISQIIMTVVVICLILWRMSYGRENGLFAEAAGLVAVIAAYIGVYYSINLLKTYNKVDLGEIVPKIIYLIIAFAIYMIMTSLAEALRKIKNIPIVGPVDRFLGAILGIAEACLIIALIEYVTDIEIVKPVLTTCYEVAYYIKKIFIKK